MRTKKLSMPILLLIILLPLITLIGVATWFITTNVEKKPLYGFEDVVNYYINNKDMVYNGQQAILDKDLVDCTIKYKTYNTVDEPIDGTPLNAGVYTIIVTDTETNHSVEVKYTIKPKSIEGANITLDQDSFAYLGSGSVEPTVTNVTIDSLTLTTNDYDISYSNNNGVGTGNVILTGKGNFTGTAIKQFAITLDEKDIIIELGAASYSKEYDKQGFAFGDIVVKSGNEELTDYQIEYAYRLIDSQTFTSGQPVNAGAYQVKVTVSKTGYKTTTIDKPVTITQREIVLQWTNTESVVYDGNPHKPNVEALNVINGDNITLTLNFGDNLIDAKTYQLSVSSIEGTDKDNYKLSSNTNTSYSYTINPRPIKLKTEIYQMNYDKAKRTWALIQNEVKNQFQFIDDDGKAWTPKSSKVLGMTDGSFSYGTSSVITNYMKQDGTNAQDNTMVGIDESYAYVVGSTYLVTAQVIDTNFTLKSTENTNLFKYKTAKIGSTYYTIEDAISASGNISFEGDSTGADTFVYTAFCNLTNVQGYPYSKTQNVSGRRMVVSCQENEVQQKYSQKAKSGYVYSALYIPNTIKLNFSSSAELMADAMIGFVHPNTTITCNRGVIFNNGTINIGNGCKLNSYGYVKGNGLVEMEEGSDTIDCMHAYDWPGGNAAKDMYKQVLPTNAWSAHNISCKSIIKAGAIYSALVYVYLDIKISVVDAAPIATLIGSSSTKNCLFKGKSGYVEKKAVPAKSWAKNSANYKDLYFVNGTNQKAGQRDDVKICGEYEDSNLKINISFTIISVSLETNTSKPATVGFMDITVENNATFNLNKSDYLFFPGSTFKIEKGGTVNIGANVDVTMLKTNDFDGVNGDRSFKKYYVDKVDSQAIINGTLNVNGNIGGVWATQEQGAVLNAYTGNVSSSYKMMISTGDPYFKSANLNSTGNIDNIEGSALEKTTYISTGKGNYYWTAATNVKTFILHFYDGSDLLTTKAIQVINSNTYTILGNEYIPTKEFYDFAGWKLENGALAEGSTLTDGNNEINLYASWTETEYSFSYMAGYGTTENGDIHYVDATYQNIISTFKISDFVNGVLNIPTTAIYQDKNFIGWYVGVDTSIGRIINSITIDQLKMFIEQYPGLPIPLYCEFTDEAIKNVSYITEIGIPIVTTDVIKPNGSIILPDMNEATYNEYINNNQFNMYFVGWRVQGTTDVIPVGTAISYDTYSEDVIFEAVWENKVEVSIDYNGGQSTDVFLKEGLIYYYAPNSTIDLINSPVKTGYNFDKWTVSSGSANNNIIIVGDSNTTIIANYVIKYFDIIVKNQSGHDLKISICYDGDEALNDTRSVKKNSSTTYKVAYDRQIKIYYYYDNSHKGFVEDNWYTVVDSKEYVLKDNGVCLIEGTLITLANGTTKKVEDLNGNDMLLVFNHETGMLDKAYAKWLIHKENEPSKQRILYLTFSNGTEIGIVGEHGFFDKDKLEYVYINENNVDEYIGHNFYTINNSNHSVKLISYRIEEKLINIYSPISNYHMNCFANGMLTMSNFLDGFINIFKLDKNMKYDEELMKKDLEMYGEGTIEEFLVVANEDIIKSFPYKYVKVSMGKGKLTYEEIEYLVKTFLTDDNKL